MSKPIKKTKGKGKWNDSIQTTLNKNMMDRFFKEGEQRGYDKEAQNMRRMIAKIFSLLDKGVIDDY